MPIATGHEREELEAELKVSIRFHYFLVRVFCVSKANIVLVWLMFLLLIVLVRERTFWKSTTPRVPLERRSVLSVLYLRYFGFIFIALI